MAKKYMGEGDPVLDALYEELDATGRKNRTDRRKRRQLEREIRKIRAGRLGGIKGLFRGLFDDVGQGLLRQHISQPQLDQFADEIEDPSFETPAQDVLGFGRKRIRVPSTAAEVVPEIEEIEVTVEKRPETEEDQWVYLDPMKLGSRVRVGTKGKYSGDLEKQFGNFSKEYSPFSKKNQRYNPETREREFRAPPDYMEKKAWRMAMPRNYAQGGTLSGQADTLARAGRGDDTMLMHVTPDEVAGLASLAPGMMTINPETGLPEAGWFRNLLGTAAPFLMSMIPGVGPVLAGAMGGGLGSLIKGGDFKDALLGAGLGALGGKVFGGMGEAGNVENLLGDAATFDPSGVSITGAVPEHVQALAGTSGSIPITIPSAVPGSLSNIPSTMGVDALTKAGLDANLLAQGTGGVDPMTFLANKGASAKQLGMFKESFAPKFDWKGATAGEKFGALKGGGLEGLKSAIFKPEGISFTALKALELQNEGQQAYEDYLLAMEEQRKQRAKDIEAYYPENVPYAGGGSIYKNRYINGNWS